MPKAPAWHRALLRRPNGEAYGHKFNVALILRDDPAFRSRLRWGNRDTPEGRDLPWRPGSGWSRWSDLDDLCLSLWLQEVGFPCRPGVVHSGLRLALQHLLPAEEVA